MVTIDEQPQNVATEIYFALCAGLIMLAFVGSMVYVTEPAEVMSYSLLYLLLLTGLYAIYKLVLWKRGRTNEEDDEY